MSRDPSRVATEVKTLIVEIMIVETMIVDKMLLVASLAVFGHPHRIFIAKF